MLWERALQRALRPSGGNAPHPDSSLGHTEQLCHAARHAHAQASMGRTRIRMRKGDDGNITREGHGKERTGFTPRHTWKRSREPCCALL